MWWFGSILFLWGIQFWIIVPIFKAETSSTSVKCDFVVYVCMNDKNSENYFNYIMFFLVRMINHQFIFVGCSPNNLKISNFG